MIIVQIDYVRRCVSRDRLSLAYEPEDLASSYMASETMRRVEVQHVPNPSLAATIGLWEDYDLSDEDKGTHRHRFSELQLESRRWSGTSLGNLVSLVWRECRATGIPARAYGRVPDERTVVESEARGTPRPYRRGANHFFDCAAMSESYDRAEVRGMVERLDSAIQSAPYLQRMLQSLAEGMGIPAQMLSVSEPGTNGRTAAEAVASSEASIVAQIRALGADTGPRPRTYEEYVAEREALRQSASGHPNITGHSLDNATRRLARHDMTPKERMIHKIRTALQSKNYPEDKIHKYLRGLKLIE